MKQRLERADKLSENGLRCPSTVAESAQRIARLALGAATENIHSDPYATMTDQELAAELERLGFEARMKPLGVKFLAEPQSGPWGTGVQSADLRQQDLHKPGALSSAQTRASGRSSMRM